MDSLMASSGPKDGSTSPSAMPLENEPGGETQGWSSGIAPPPSLSPRGTTNSLSSPCLPLSNKSQAKNQQRGWQYSTKYHTLENKNQVNKTKWGVFGYISLLCERGPSGLTHFLGVMFVSFANATGRNQPACRGMRKWQNTTGTRNFFFYLST